MAMTNIKGYITEDNKRLHPLFVQKDRRAARGRCQSHGRTAATSPIGDKRRGLRSKKRTLADRVEEKTDSYFVKSLDFYKRVCYTPYKIGALFAPLGGL